MDGKQEKTPRNRLDKLKTLARQEGIKLTPQRIEIFEEVMSSGNHPSAEEVYSRVRLRLPTISLDTVYRALDTFEQIGLIARVEVLDDRIRFDPIVSSHPHLVCTRCKGIKDFSWPAATDLKPPESAKRWGLVIGIHLELWGVCRRCLRARSRKRKNGPDTCA